jgi:flagellin
MRINTNIASLTAMESNYQVNKNLTNSLEKLSSGLRINKASDDASGLAIDDKLRTQSNSLMQAVSNGNSAVALVQIADKAMGEQSNILDIVKQKLVQASTATTSAEGREALRKDISKLLDQLDNIAKQTNYNGIQLLQTGTAVDGDKVAADLDFIMGESASNKISVGKDVQSNAKGLGLDTLRDTAADGLTAADAGTAMATVDAALNKLNGWRSDFGSTQNQVESAIRNLNTQITNIKAAESVIRDVDMAQESANFNKQNIIAQAGTYAISQANSMQQNVLRLLQ